MLASEPGLSGRAPLFRLQLLEAPLQRNALTQGGIHPVAAEGQAQLVDEPGSLRHGFSHTTPPFFFLGDVLRV